MVTIDQEQREELDQLHADAQRAIDNLVLEQLDYTPPCVGWPVGEGCTEDATAIVSCRVCLTSAFFGDSCIEKLRQLSGSKQLRRAGKVFECGRCKTFSTSFDQGYIVTPIGHRA